MHETTPHWSTVDFIKVETACATVVRLRPSLGPLQRSQRSAVPPDHLTRVGQVVQHFFQDELQPVQDQIGRLDKEKGLRVIWCVDIATTTSDGQPPGDHLSLRGNATPPTALEHPYSASLLQGPPHR
eukprot:1195667-Prorocentrum_minimum.AAC.11